MKFVNLGKIFLTVVFVFFAICGASIVNEVVTPIGYAIVLFIGIVYVLVQGLKKIVSIIKNIRSTGSNKKHESQITYTVKQ